MGLSTYLRDVAGTALRGVQLVAFTETGTLYAGTVADDSGGAGTIGWAAVNTAGWGTAIPCRLRPVGQAGDAERITAGRLDDRSTHLVAAPAGLPVERTHRFAVAGRGDFEVTAVHDETAAQACFFEVTPAS
jgi:hypothetical protein